VNHGRYRNCLQAIGDIEYELRNNEFREIISEDPRNLFLLASARKCLMSLMVIKAETWSPRPMAAGRLLHSQDGPSD